MKLKLSPATAWVASNAGIAPTPELIVRLPIPFVTALPPLGVYVVPTLLPVTLYELPIRSEGSVLSERSL